MFIIEFQARTFKMVCAIRLMAGMKQKLILCLLSFVPYPLKH